MAQGPFHLLQGLSLLLVLALYLVFPTLFQLILVPLLPLLILVMTSCWLLLQMLFQRALLLLLVVFAAGMARRLVLEDLVLLGAITRQMRGLKGKVEVWGRVKGMVVGGWMKLLRWTVTAIECRMGVTHPVGMAKHQVGAVVARGESHLVELAR